MMVSKKALGIAGAGLLLALVGGYVLFMSPKSTTVKFAVGHPAMASTDAQTVTGSVSPAESGRLVIVEASSGSGWSEVVRTSTDATGSYKVEFGMAERGLQKVRVRVEKDGRQKAAVSSVESVTVLSPTQLEAQIPKFARTDRPMRISGRVGPAAVRALTIEKSSDGQDWAPAGQGASQASGQFTVTASDFAAGQVQLRVTVAASDTGASTTSAVQTVSVEDYRAAGQRYLQIVKPVNSLLDEFNEATQGDDATKARQIAAQLSTAETKQARHFRQYAYWPQEVKASIELMAKRCILDADYFNRLSHTKTVAEFIALDYPTGPKGADDAPVVVRAALGLPKRD